MMLHWLYLLAVASSLLHCSTAAAIRTCTSSMQNNLRLYNPNGNSGTDGGMLQVCRSGTWYAVCDYTFDCTTEGRAACKQLGYGGTNMRVAFMYNSATHFGSWSYYRRGYYYCYSTSSSLTSCSYYNTYSSYCNYNDHAGLWCLTVPPAVPQCTNGALRLVGGESSREGRLEYCYYGVWSQFCNNFQIEEATVACKQLGFNNSPKPAIFTDRRFGITSDYSLFSYFSCSPSATENNMTSCSLIDSCAVRCTTFYAISCHEPHEDNCTEGMVRLVNSISESEGRVETCFHGTWGPVCNIGQTGAYVVCRSLGYDAAPRAYSPNSFGDGTRPAAYVVSSCFGWENSISECTRQARATCSRSQVAGVTCRDGCTNNTVRLVGGSSKAEGTVEVCYDQTWRTVASWQWTEEDAQVVCRQLGLLTEGVVSHLNSPFGKPRRSVFLSGVQCNGSEARLVDCPANRVSYENGKILLSHIHMAGVICKVPLTTSIMMTCLAPTPPPPPECLNTKCVCPTYTEGTPLSTPCPTTSDLKETVTSTITKYSISTCPEPTLTSTLECPTTQCPSLTCSTPTPAPPPLPCSTQECPTMTCPAPTVSTYTLSSCPTQSTVTCPPQQSSIPLPPQKFFTTPFPQHASILAPPHYIFSSLLNSQQKVLQTVLARTDESCLSYFNEMVALCVVFSLVTCILGVGLCYMIYKNGRMRGRIKERSIIDSHGIINSIYTQSSIAQEEDSCKEGEAVEENGEKKNAYEGL